NDPRPPRVTSGLRIGTPALATRGFGAEEFTEVADIIALALTGDTDLASLRARTEALAAKPPLYAGLQQNGASPWRTARRAGPHTRPRYAPPSPQERHDCPAPRRQGHREDHQAGARRAGEPTPRGRPQASGPGDGAG